MIAPALRQLSESRELLGLDIDVVTRKVGGEVLMNSGCFDRLFVLNGFGSVVCILSKLISVEYRAVLVFHVSDRLSWFVALATDANRVCHGDWVRQKFPKRFNKRVIQVATNESMHIVDRHLSLVAKVFELKRCAREQFVFWTPRDVRDQLFEKVSSQLSLEVTVALFPGGADPYKCWPTDQFVKVGKMLVARGYQIAVVGSKLDQKRVDPLVSSIPSAVKIELPILGLAAFFNQCRLVISNDSGPAHLAVAAGAKTLILFGPTNPVVSCPIGQNNVKSLRYGVTCFPSTEFEITESECKNKKCQRPLCMKKIDEVQVFHAALDLLEDS